MTEQYFVCQNCCLELPNKADVKQHMLEVHGIDTGKVTCSKRMVSHIDARDWFSFEYSYTWEEPPVLLFEYTRQDRDDKEDE